MSNKFISIHKVRELTSLGRSTIYRRASDPKDDFPRQRAIGKRRTAWIEADITSWMENIISQHNNSEVV